MTYAKVQKDIESTHGLTVKTCWIAHVKELNGIETRKAPNRINVNKRKYPCPEDKRQMIEESMHKFGML